MVRAHTPPTALFSALSLCAVGALSTGAWAQNSISRESVSTSGAQANDGSAAPSVTFDGRFVVFFSDATNLIAGPHNGKRQIYLRDRFTNTTTVVSVANSGELGDGDSAWAAISQSGAVVAFESVATNLSGIDANELRDIYVRDLSKGVTERLTVAADGSETDGNSYHPSASFDGRYIVFHSDATNLVAGDVNLCSDVFIRDRVAGVTQRVSTNAFGVAGNGPSRHATVSADGAIVVFESDATNLDSSDTNGATDIFVKNMVTGSVKRITNNASGAAAAGHSADARLTPDGRFVVFTSDATDLKVANAGNPSNPAGRRLVYVADLFSGLIERASSTVSGGVPDANCYIPDISADGRFITYSSPSSLIVAGDANGREDAFVYDRQLKQSVRVSLAADGTQIDGFADFTTISGDGTFVAFMSDATNLMPSDYLGEVQIYGFDFKMGAPPAPLPFQTLSIDIERARIANGKKTSGDSILVTGIFMMNQLSPDGELNPLIENIEFRTGDLTQPATFQIPANDPNWKKFKNGNLVWKSKPGAGPAIYFKFEPANARFTIRVSRFDFAVFPQNDVYFRLQIGNDMGLAYKSWTVANKGKALLVSKKK
jgi:Tol biopolymer transport system component